MKEDVFALYDMPEKAQAEKEIIDLINDFMVKLAHLQSKWAKVGASDTHSRELIAIYIAKEKLGLV